MVNTAIAARIAALRGMPAPNDSAKERPFTAFTGLREETSPALLGAPENSQHKAKNITAAATIEITILFFITVFRQ